MNNDMYEGYTETPAILMPWYDEDDEIWHEAAYYKWEGKGEPPDGIVAYMDSTGEGQPDTDIHELPTEEEVLAAEQEYLAWVEEHGEDPLGRADIYG